MTHNGLKYVVKQQTMRFLGLLLKHTNACDKKTPVFIIGCQRSGTTMLDGIFRHSDQITAYGERFAALGDGWRLRPVGNIYYLISRSKTPIIEFKPLNDAQNIDCILKAYRRAKVIWVYRNFLDVANSMVEKWGDLQIKQLQQIAIDKYSNRGVAALGERLSSKNRELAKKLSTQNPSAYDAAAYIWLIRNSLYFERQLDSNPNVMLCQYEDMVKEPEHCIQRIFNFIGAEFSKNYVADVRTSSIGKHKAPEIKTDLKVLCEDLAVKMKYQYHFQLSSNKS